MAEETAPPSPGASKDSLDLNSLSGLSFGPDWADGKPSKSPNLKRFEGGGDRKGKGKRSGSSSSHDRRSGGRPDRSRGDRGRGRPGQDRDDSRRRDTRPTFEPTVKVDLYPQDEAFDALVKRLRSSARTYQLFEIAHLLLEKPERYVAVVSPKQSGRDKGESNPLLYYSVPGHLPFESEEQAIDYVLKEHIEQFFDVEEIEVEPPSGNFQMVNRCSITGELLGPPNYHRFQEFVQRHYANRITGMSFERFQSKIVGSKEQEDIDAWLESMKRGARYTVKERQENEAEYFESLEAARHFLLTHRKEQVVGSGESVRFAGRDIERMPIGSIRRSVESYVEQQKHFPLDSANNIRGRLRRHKFAVYKKGSKGVSFVCAVKRKFRDSKTVFTDSIRDLIDFIEKHPDIPASKLSKEYIGIDTEKQKPEVLEMKEAKATPGNATPEEATPEEATPENATPEDATPENATPEDAAPEANTVPETNTTSEVEISPEKPEKDDAPKVDSATVEASTQATPKETLSDDEQQKLNQLMLDLRWLITEGYVTEYGDGRLFAPAPLPEPSKKPEPPKQDATPKKSKEGPKKNESQPADVATDGVKDVVADETVADSSIAATSEENTADDEPPTGL